MELKINNQPAVQLLTFNQDGLATFNPIPYLSLTLSLTLTLTLTQTRTAWSPPSSTTSRLEARAARRPFCGWSAAASRQGVACAQRQRAYDLVTTPHWCYGVSGLGGLVCRRVCRALAPRSFRVSALCFSLHSIRLQMKKLNKAFEKRILFKTKL